MTPFSTEVRTLFRLLEDRGWHDWREIKERLAATVAPGKALRKYEERLTKRRDRGGHAPMPNDLSEDDKILYGQRLLADAAMQGIKRRWLEVEHNAGGFSMKMVRLQPGVEIPDQPRDGTISGAEEPDDDEDEQELTEEPDEELGDVLSGPREVFADRPPETSRRGLAAAARPYSCGECGTYVPDPKTHADFHAQFVRRDLIDEVPPPPLPREEMALFSETEVRAILAQEVGLQLDAFQTGMQQWLLEFLGDSDRACLLRSLHGQGIPIQR